MATSSPPKIDPELIVQPRGPQERRVLSLNQQRLWYLAQLTPGNPAYNVPFYSRLHGHLHVEHLRNGLNAVVERHEVLRTVILAPQSGPMPVLLKKWALEFKQLDLRHLPQVEREIEAQRLLQEEGARPFNLARDVLLRILLLQLDEDEYIFLHNSHHIGFEGGSIGLFYRDLAAFYEASLQNRAPDIPPLPVQYADFALWQRNRLQGERLGSLASFWREQLAGIQNVNLPLDFPRPAIHTMRGVRHFFSLSGLIAQANQFFRDSGTTSYRGLCAAFSVFLYCYTEQPDILLGSPFAPRCAGIENLIGFFVNTVVVRTSLAENPTFREVMRRVDTSVRGAIQHSELTFDRLVEAARIARDPSRTPLFQVNFRAPKEPYPRLQLTGADGETARYIENGTSKFDLALEIESSQGGVCYFEYCSDLFTEQTISEMIADLKDVLLGVMAQPDIALNDLPVMLKIKQRIRDAGRGR